MYTSSMQQSEFVKPITVCKIHYVISSCCCVSGSWLLSDPITYMYVMYLWMYVYVHTYIPNEQMKQYMYIAMYVCMC